MTGLTRSGTECFIAVPIWQQWASKGKVLRTNYGLHWPKSWPKISRVSEWVYGANNTKYTITTSSSQQRKRYSTEWRTADNACRQLHQASFKWFVTAARDLSTVRQQRKSTPDVESTLWRPLLPHGYSCYRPKHPMPDRVKPSFVIFDIRALWRSALSVRVPGCQKLQMAS